MAIVVQKYGGSSVAGVEKIGRVAELKDTPEVRGMIAKVQHLVRIVDEK